MALGYYSAPTSLKLIIEFSSHLAAKSDKYRRRPSPLLLDEEREALARNRGPNVCMVRTSPKIERGLLVVTTALKTTNLLLKQTDWVTSDEATVVY